MSLSSSVIVLRIFGLLRLRPFIFSLVYETFDCYPNSSSSFDIALVWLNFVHDWESYHMIQSEFLFLFKIMGISSLPRSLWLIANF